MTFKKRHIILGLIVAIVVPFAVLTWKNWSAIKDYTVRNYKMATMSKLRKVSIEMYAGCQPRTMMELVSDEGFTNTWLKDSAQYDFDAKDIDMWMMEMCPPQTDAKIEEIYTSYYNSVDYPDMDEEKEKETWIAKEKSMNAYQRKFLNREFTALKNEPKSEFLSEVAPE